MTPGVPHDIAAEEALIGELIVGYREVRSVLAWFQPEWFYRPLHQRAFDAISAIFADGDTPDPIGVADWMRRNGEPEENILEINWTQFRATGAWRRHARIVAGLAGQRRLLANLSEARQAILDGDEQRVVDELEAAILEGRQPPDQPPADVFGVWQLSEMAADADAGWIIPGMLGRDHRAVIVAFEGVGKSVLLSQFAVLTAAGVHPLWMPAHIPPMVTLLCDFENPARLVKERAQSLVATAGGPTKAEGFHVWHRPGGINLRKRTDRALFESILAAHRPDLVCMGPAYKMYRRAGKESDEEAILDVHAILDDLRMRYGFGLMIEHHAPFESGGKRQARPFGTSLWMRWPEFGIGLEAPTDKNAPRGSLAFGRFRPDRVEANWPDRMDRGGEVPWTGFWKDGFSGLLETLDF
jgi:hypothetical protein